MLTYEQMSYHPTSEKLVKILCDKTQNTEPLFFRVMVAYYFAVCAAQMRCSIATPDRGDIPVNFYGLNLSPSGTGKGHSTNIVEEQVINQFRERFLTETFPLQAEMNLPKLANKRAIRKSADPDDELEKVQKEFNALGTLLFSFDSGTSPAVKQMRHKLLMADAGSVNLEIDEIGLKLVGETEVLTTFLELYDKGLVKTKLIKSTTDNVRNEEIRGATPTNMMLFGTPSKLFDGAQTEQQLYSMLETGYARRCFFGYMKGASKNLSLTPEQIYDMLTNSSSSDFLNNLSDSLYDLADPINLNQKLVMEKEVALLLIEYKLKCEIEAAKLSEHEEMRKAELTHRYFKALKLAGAYAFIDSSPEVTKEHLYNAIKLAEDSGTSFNMMLTRDRPYVKLAKYLASIKKEVTQADLVEDLPFYRGSAATKAELFTLATAYGYKNNIIIKKKYDDGIEFITGESLKETDLSKMVFSYSTEMTDNYQNIEAPFDKLVNMMGANGYHWINHHLTNGYRLGENIVSGFNMIVLDVDGQCSLQVAKLLLSKYKALYYTTKSHTDSCNRFRIVLPINYRLTLDEKDYKEMYQSIIDWLPFAVDESCGHRVKKWMSNAGHAEYVDGELFDILPFIPKTSKNEERKQLFSTQQSMENLERWVVNNSGDGNRNNMLLRYAMLMKDIGYSYDQIVSKVMALNDKMPNKLDENEITSTILVTLAKSLMR